jgi:peroxiredoxin Q/BCP
MVLQAGDVAPDFELEDSGGQRWRLSALRGQRVILFFYPADDTPGCTAEACDFRDARNDLAAAGYAVFGISPQDKSSHQAFSAKHGLNYPLLVDADLSVAKAYGTWAEEPGEFNGMPLETKRSTFVIDEQGVIVEARYGVNARTHVDELREALL